MKRYQCNKVVTAGVITNLFAMPRGANYPLGGGIEITLDDKSMFYVEGERFEKAKVGQYFVIYEDGYQSINPDLAGYRELAGGCVPFGVAIEALKAGQAITRTGWNGKGMFVYLVPGNAFPASTAVAKAFYGDELVPYNAYMALKGADGRVSTWAPSGSDCLADDWMAVDLIGVSILAQKPGQ